MRCLLPHASPPHLCDIRRRTIQVTAPAAGVDWSVQVPVAEAWDVQGLVATLTTSVVVANRTAVLEVLDSAVVIFASQPSNSQAAGVAGLWTLESGGPTGSNANSLAHAWGSGAPFVIHPGRTLTVVTNNLDVADQWSAIVLDVIFELNRGAGAAKRYADWREAEMAALPAARLRSGDLYRG